MVKLPMNAAVGVVGSNPLGIPSLSGMGSPGLVRADLLAGHVVHQEHGLPGQAGAGDDVGGWDLVAQPLDELGFGVRHGFLLSGWW